MNNYPDYSTLKTPPHSEESEQAFLSAVMERNTLVEDVEGIISPDSFYRMPNKVIFRRMVTMAFVCQPIDPVTLINALDEAGQLDDAGGQDYVIELATSGRGALNAIHYAQIIADRAVDRDLIIRGQNISALAYAEGTAQEKIDQAQSMVMDASAEASTEVLSAAESMRETVEHIEFLFNNKGKLTGITTGLQDLDRITYGLQKSDMIVIAGRPSSGKTTLAMNLAEAAMMAGEMVLVFSLEMPRAQLMTRLTCSIGKIPLDHVKRGNMEWHWEKLSAAGHKLKEFGGNLYIDERSYVTSEHLLSRARRIARKLNRKIGLVVIDYMQLLRDKGEGNERMSNISRNIKSTARELDCPVVALSQLSRKCEERRDKRPINSDLRDSGAIEQDSDVIMMVYRDKAYHEESPYGDTAELILTKHRNGEIGTVFLKSELHQCRFENNVGFQRPMVDDKKGGRYAALR